MVIKKSCPCRLYTLKVLAGFRRQDSGGFFHYFVLIYKDFASLFRRLTLLLTSGAPQWVTHAVWTSGPAWRMASPGRQCVFLSAALRGWQRRARGCPEPGCLDRNVGSRILVLRQQVDTETAGAKVPFSDVNGWAEPFLLLLQSLLLVNYETRRRGTHSCSLTRSCVARVFLHLPIQATGKWLVSALWEPLSLLLLSPA